METYGYDIVCTGCNAAKLNSAYRRNHSNECRERIRKLIESEATETKAVKRMKAADQRTRGEKREREGTEQKDEQSMEQDTTDKQPQSTEQDAADKQPQEVATGSNSPVTYSIPDEHTSPTNPKNMDVGLLGQIYIYIYRS